MKIFSCFLCISALLFKVISGQDPPGTATYLCERTGTVNTLTVTYVLDTQPPDVHVKLQVAGDPDAACADITIADNKLELVLSPIDTANGVCGIKQGATDPGPLLADAIFYLTKDTGNLLQSSDYALTIPLGDCDFSDTTPATQTPTITPIDVTGDLTDGAITKLTPTATLNLVASATPETDITTCALGAAVKLKLTMTGGGATGLHATGCTVKSVPDVPANTLDLITGSCVPDPAPVGATAVSGFTYNTALSTATTNYVTVMTNQFDCFRYSTSTQITISCTVEFCTSDITVLTPSGNKCQISSDSCNNKALGQSSRKRRDVRENLVNQTMVSLTINVGTHDSASKNLKDQGCSDTVHQTVFITVVTILAVLLVMSMTATVFVARKYNRSMDSNPPPYPTKGVDNPAF